MSGIVHSPLDVPLEEWKDVDVLAPKLYANGYPHDLWRRLRSESPVHFFPKGVIPYWAVTRRRDIEHVSRNPELFSSEQFIMVSEYQGGELRLREMIEMDPPRHRVFRRLISPRFTPRAVRNMRDRIDRIARPGRGW
jgi:cholest-4-en-3-one 26-monooxygenase